MVRMYRFVFLLCTVHSLVLELILLSIQCMRNTAALIAVQHLSFGSTKVRHLDAIDDVLIANNIANSANGEKTESYNYWWSWQDNSGEDIQQRFSRLRSESSSMFGVFPSMQQDSFGGSDFPFSFFGCGNLCGADTSVENDARQNGSH